jgi:hypothetical protein
MDINTKNQLKAELTGVRALAQGASGLAATVGAQIAFPIPPGGVGGVIMIPGLQQASQALLLQKDVMEKMIKLLEKVIDKA